MVQERSLISVNMSSDVSVTAIALGAWLQSPRRPDVQRRLLLSLEWFLDFEQHGFTTSPAARTGLAHVYFGSGAHLSHKTFRWFAFAFGQTRDVLYLSIGRVLCVKNSSRVPRHTLFQAPEIFRFFSFFDKHPGPSKKQTPRSRQRDFPYDISAKLSYNQARHSSSFHH